MVRNNLLPLTRTQNNEHTGPALELTAAVAAQDGSPSSPPVSRTVVLGACSGCVADGRGASTCTYYPRAYHEEMARRRPEEEEPAASSSSAPPPPLRLGLACNSGVSQAEQELWGPTVDALLAAGVAVAFTSYNEEEARGELWRRCAC